MRLIYFVVALSLLGCVSSASALTNAQIKQKIIERSIADYLATYAICPCPYSKDKYQKPCGESNAWTVSGHHTVYCYPEDVPDSAVQSFKH